MPYRFRPGELYRKQWVEEWAFTAMISDLRLNKIDIVRSMHSKELVYNYSHFLGCAINHLEWLRFFWILPQRRQISPWSAISPNAVGSIAILFLLLIATWWMIAKSYPDGCYCSLIYTAFAIFQLSLAIGAPVIPESKKLKCFLIFVLLVFIPINVSVQSIWISTLTNPIREPKITNVQKLAESYLPMKFLRMLFDNVVAFGLDKKYVNMINEKWRENSEGKDDDLFGKSGIAVLTNEKRLSIIRNMWEVESFLQVRYAQYISFA